MKILVIGPAWIGDMVIAQVLFKALKQKYPQAIIDVLAPDWTLGLLERMPEVHSAISLPLKHGEWGFLKRFKLGKTLRNKNYAQAFVLPNTWKSALIPFFAKIPVRTGWMGEMRRGLLNNIMGSTPKKSCKLMAERFLALAGNLTPEDIKDRSAEKSEKINSSLKIRPAFLPALKSLKFNINIYINIKYSVINNCLTSQDFSKRIALCPGAEFGPSKRWPAKHYAKIADYCLEKNYTVFLIGASKDCAAAEKINVLTQNRCINLTGKTSLGEAIDLLACVGLVIANDSGLMHIAAALNKNLIALYGSTDPGFTPPLCQENKAEIIFIEPERLPCRPCFKRECPLKHHKCMEDLLPARVIQAVEKFESCAY